MSTEQTHTFKAEIKQLLNILIHSLYQEREIFLRELISNASDALTRMQFEMLTNSNVVDPDAELAIQISSVEDDERPRLIIKDSGIGMTPEELARNLGTIAQSGAREFLSQIEEGKQTATDIIGRFGVGFYSVFMVADEVRVVSRSYHPEATASAWISDGGESYRIEEAEKADRGTEIHITLKKDATEFAKSWKLREVIKRHSDYVGYPIMIDGEQANQQKSLWRKRPNKVEADEYKQFYQQMTLDFEDPLETIHFSADVPVNLRALLFIPARRERTMFALRKEPGVKLYSNNVLIQEYCTDLLPEWLGWIDGVVDSEDLPLNVSRETVQNNRLMQQLGDIIRKRVLRTIRELGEQEAGGQESAGQEAGRFAKLWREYGRVIKEGLAIDPANESDIVPLLHFASSRSNGALVSLATYVQRMAEDQTAIYYVLGDSLATVANSPHLDPFKARGWEVLYLVDPIDAFIINNWHTFEGKTLVNVEDAEIELPEPDEPATDADAEKALNLLIGRCVTTLGARVTEVKLSRVLTDSPVRLVAPENGSVPSNMDRIYRMMKQDYEVPQRRLELNRHHPLIVNLAQRLERDDAGELVDLTIEQLYESALVQEGLHPNPSTMIPRIQRLMELASAG